MGRLLAIGFSTLLLAVSLGACGGSDSPTEEREARDREQIEAVAKRFAVAVAAEDAKAFCATLLPNDVQKLGEGKNDGSKRCLVVWGKDRNPLFQAKNANLELEEITELKGPSATATLATGGELAFAKEGGAWHVHLAPAKE